MRRQNSPLAHVVDEGAGWLESADGAMTPTIGVIHDLRNLLGLLALQAQLLERNPSTDEVRACVEAMRAIVEEGRSLASLLLNESVTPFATVQDAIASLRSLLQMVDGRNTRISLEVNGKWEKSMLLQRIGLSSIDFRRIFFNLIHNALAATSDGDEIRVRVTPPQTPESWITLEVLDTGIGMDEETVARVFTPGFRKGPVGGGLGVGLTVVQTLTVEAGGHVEVKSNPGVGTAFTIFLPVVESSSLP